MSDDATPRITNLRRAAEDAVAAKLKKLPTEDDENSAQVSVDVYETNDRLFIVAPLAGVSKEKVNVEITDDLVTIEGTRPHPLDGSVDMEKDSLVQECYFGDFNRAIVLPETVDGARAIARFTDCVLTVELPKLDSRKTRIIDIQEN